MNEQSSDPVLNAIQDYDELKAKLKEDYAERLESLEDGLAGLIAHHNRLVQECAKLGGVVMAMADLFERLAEHVKLPKNNEKRLIVPSPALPTGD